MFVITELIVTEFDCNYKFWLNIFFSSGKMLHKNIHKSLKPSFFHFSDIGSLLGDFNLDGPGGSMPGGPGGLSNEDIEDINLFDFDGNLTDLDLVCYRSCCDH